MRIAIAGFMHESNTFNPQPTDRTAFSDQSLCFGAQVLEEWRDSHHEMGGFIEASRVEGFDLEPLVMAWATPAGPVADAAFEEITGHILAGLARTKPDGLLLALHGAMVAQSFPDADGEILARVRRAVGPDFPIVTTFDLHGNISSRAVENCQAAVAYRTYPHVDQRECGLRAARLLSRMLRREIHPRLALAKPPLIVNILRQDTARPPTSDLYARARELEGRKGILAVSLLPGFAYADVPHMGPSVLVVADGDPELARREADGLADQLWACRDQLTAELPDARAAVEQALRTERRPVVLVDCGDNVGGGSAADGTVLLAELFRQGASGSVVCLFAPAEARRCAAAGIGAQVDFTVGGKVDRLHGEPVPFSGRVRVLHDGTYLEPEARHGGRRLNHMGLSALVEGPEDNYLVLNSQRHPPFSLGQLTCLGIQPQLRRILVVKAAVAYKAAYAPMTGSVIEVDTPGLTAVNPRRFAYRHIRRPMFPLEEPRP